MKKSGGPVMLDSVAGDTLPSKCGWLQKLLTSYHQRGTWLFVFATACVLHAESLVVSDSLQPCGLWPARLLCPWHSPDKNTGRALPWLPPGVLLNSEIQTVSPVVPVLYVDSLPLSHQ